MIDINKNVYLARRSLQLRHRVTAKSVYIIQVKENPIYAISGKT